MKKDDFIKSLEKLDKDDIDNLIKEKGKQPKLVTFITKFDNKEVDKDANSKKI
jgi:hypothetical protein